MTTHRPPTRASRQGVRRAMAAACGLALAATRAHAQLGAAPPGPYERARLLVEAGRGAAGRLLADSLVARSAPGSPARAEALWWRAALAVDGAAAERDLRRLLGEVPTSPRAGAATVRLAQLALVRDRPEEATALLDPLVRGPAGDAPGDFARPQAAYWLARARLEQRDAAGACAALDSVAGAALEPSLAGQVAALRRRVPGCAAAPGADAVAVVPRSAPAPSQAPSQAPSRAPQQTLALAPPTTRPAAQPSSPARPTVAPPLTPAPATTASVAGQPPVAIPPGPVPGPPAESPSASPAVPAPAPRPGPAVPARSTPAPAASAPAPTTTSAPDRTPSAGAAPAAAAPSTAPAYAVQVAAYDTRPGAEALAARLRAGGLDARAEGQGAAGDAAPFRIKVGRYPTRAAAAAALHELRARGLTGFVTTAGGRP